MSGIAIDFNKPFKFHGNHFKRWQTKIMFFLTRKKVSHILKEDIPVIPVMSIPQGSTTNGKTTMDTNTSVPTKNAELERLTAEYTEKVKQAEKDILLWQRVRY